MLGAMHQHRTHGGRTSAYSTMAWCRASSGEPLDHPAVDCAWGAGNSLWPERH